MDLENEKSKKSYRILTIYQKKVILAEIHEGKKHPEEILKEHGVASEYSNIARRWPEQIKRNENNPFIIPRKKYDEAFKRDVIRQIEFRQITEKEAIQRFDIVGGKAVIKYWRKKYSSDITTVSPTEIMNQPEDKDLTEIEKQKKELEKALELANLKIIGLETMIDIAEKELEINIRKKSGTKQ